MIGKKRNLNYFLTHTNHSALTYIIRIITSSSKTIFKTVVEYTRKKFTSDQYVVNYLKIYSVKNSTFQET